MRTVEISKDGGRPRRGGEVTRIEHHVTGLESKDTRYSNRQRLTNLVVTINYVRIIQRGQMQERRNHQVMSMLDATYPSFEV